MKVAIVVLAVLAVAVTASLPALTHQESTFLFSRWMKEHGKSYQSSAEFDNRLAVFKANAERVRNHMANPKRSWDMSLNKFADLTSLEFAEMYLGYVPRQNEYLRSKNTKVFPTKGLPATVDWVSANKVTPVKDQGQCGSCWSFSTTGSIESAYGIENGMSGDSLISLSEQELVDCSQSAGNQGCEGGLMDDAFNWIISNGGLCTEDAYPYTASDGTCASTNCTSAVTITAYTDVTPDSESQLQAACAQQPVSIAVDASEGWQMFSGGILDSSSGCADNLDHGVLLVGYGTDSGEAYWKVKNSWGSSWGESGYIRLKRNVGGAGTCGLCSDPSYPTGAKAPSKRHHRRV